MIPEEIARRERLHSLKEAGVNPYPAKTNRSHNLHDVLSSFDQLESSKEKVTVIGRIRSLRKHGGLTFLTLEDASGKMQLALKRDNVGTDSYIFFHDHIDVGDFLQVTGTVFTTKKGENSIDILKWNIVTKTLLPLPEKWHGLTDTETRFRKRYLDLIMNEDVRNRMLTRSKIISSIRNLLDERDFTEVETPTLQPVYGGGFARPFTTHHNALDVDFYLRISDEMYLKRLLVGGMEKIYEITKVFRNEGIDRDHNPEFTMFEAQIAFEDYTYGMDLFEEIFENAAIKVLGSTQVEHNDVTIELKRPWKRIKLIDAVESIGGIPSDTWVNLDEAKLVLKEKLNNKKLKDIERIEKSGELMAFAFEELVEEKLIQPTIVYDYPVEVSPLAKRGADPRFTERFEAFALGSEIGNNYSELNDPLDLEQRFIEEKKRKESGYDEAHEPDLDYLDAIKHGMPPSCGLGIGVDRMVMLLTGVRNIKEVILFPTLKPKPYDESEKSDGLRDV